ncbi:MAG TPA: Mov34/MPN/PAD-1 family protein [Gemmataceae bacterium]|nr:Mov34/MPN/PAD-1 family protein [Gemmataceae bacterium]
MVRTMLQGLVSRARQLAQDLQRSLLRPVPPPTPARPAARPVPAAYGPLGRVLLTDGVGRTLFEEFADHRAAARGEEETGWVLVGLREASEAVVLATFPAGTRRDAGVAHIRFDSSGQVVASRIIRQADRRLTILGVVHTHPGSLRHPSDGDLRGDGQWVRHLRGREGVFGIGTADAPGADAMFAYQPRPHVHCLGELRFSWYALGEGDGAYRPLPAELTIGPDLARPLHAIWEMLESHAERIDRLYRQQAGVRFAVTEDEWGPGLILTVPLAAGGDAIRVVVRPKGVFYYVLQGGEVLEVQHHDEQVDRGVYLLLAELASRA